MALAAGGKGQGEATDVVGTRAHTYVLPLAPGMADYLDRLFLQRSDEAARSAWRSPASARPRTGVTARSGPSNAVAAAAVPLLSLPKRKRGRPSKADILERSRLAAAFKAHGDAGPKGSAQLFPNSGWVPPLGEGGEGRELTGAWGASGAPVAGWQQPTVNDP